MKNVLNVTLITLMVFSFMVALFYLAATRETIRTGHTIDTIIIRDTVRDTVLIPQSVYIVRIDTVFLHPPADTVFHEVLVPIERKEYTTANYSAIVEGFRVGLVSMEVYPETRIISDRQVQIIKKRPRFGVGVQVGYGLARDRASPYIGIGMQYNIFNF